MTSVALAVGDRVKGSIASEVTTEGTDWDGAGHTADSGWTVFTVPVNHVINRDMTVVNELSANGRETEAKVAYEDNIEIVPGSGLKSPRTIKVKTHARSPRGVGNAGVRGWMKVRVDFEYVQYTRAV